MKFIQVFKKSDKNVKKKKEIHRRVFLLLKVKYSYNVKQRYLTQ